jgi:hypothetical protein
MCRVVASKCPDSLDLIDDQGKIERTETSQHHASVTLREMWE